jgi:hypothetical protein
VDRSTVSPHNFQAVETIVPAICHVFDSHGEEIRTRCVHHSFYLIVSKVFSCEVLHQLLAEVEIARLKDQAEWWEGKIFPSVFRVVVAVGILGCTGYSLSVPGSGTNGEGKHS